MEIMSYRPPVLPEHVPEVRKREDPRDAPEKGVEAELGEVHPGRACRERDERAHDGQAAGAKDRELAVLVEPLLRDDKVVRPDADVLSVAEPQLPPAPQPDEVGDPGAHQVPEDAGRHRAEERHPAFGDEVARERGDSLRRDQDTHALEQHQHEDRRQSVAPDGLRHEVYERREYRFEHPRKLSPRRRDFHGLRRRTADGSSYRRPFRRCSTALSPRTESQSAETPPTATGR